MKNKDFSQIRLDDIDIFRDRSNGCYNILFTKKIRTLSQILDDDLMNSIMINCKRETRQVIDAYVSLAKYKYLGVPLACDEELEEEYAWYHMPDFGFNKSIIFDIQRCVNNDHIFEGKTVLEVFKIIAEDKDKKLSTFHHESIKKIIKMYIESYEKSKFDSKNDEKEPIEGKNLDEVDVLSILKSQLTNLISTRDGLNTKIISLQEKIELLSNHQPENGIKR